MASITGDVLSGSTNGLPILVAATSIGSGTTIHTAVASTSTNVFDEITLFVSNTDTAAHTLTIGWGGVTDPDNLICKAVSIPANSGPIPIVTGVRLKNTLVVKAAADTTNKLTITGFYNRVQ